MENKNVIRFGVATTVIIILAGIIYVQFFQEKNEADNYIMPDPSDVVRQYFVSWNNKDWPDMYATLSDGFKNIDPDAKNLTSFRNFASSQGVEGINIIGIQLELMTMNGKPVDKNMPGMPDMEEAVNYRVEFILDGDQKRNFNGTFILKYRQGDVIQGWKLIHPYGNNADNS